MAFLTRVAFTRKTHEYDDVYSYFFERAAVRYIAGQYTHVQAGPAWSRQGVRELSFASAPHEDELRFTVHVGSGSGYKQRLEALRPGDTVGLFFTGGKPLLPDQTDRPLVFISGGVGAAPLRSLILEAQRRGGYDLRVVQVQRGDHLYRGELEPIVSRYDAVHPDDFAKGIGRAVADAPDAIVYACGSTRFATAAAERISAAGIDKRDQHIKTWH
ncbi:ferredoxin--NADP reductase [Microbacterium sp. NPDC077663]|uniref:ferredoxin--NADP reductase n=1 Tax=Microbacterium sp. NPDC077663 TaxID=3364189 RepID=UPI0037C5E1FC